jgi:hypothetical protein
MRYNPVPMRPLIYFTRELPGISEKLSQAGFEVHEALSISEVLFLAEQHTGAQVVVGQTVEENAAREVAQRLVTLRLKPQATVADVIWELSLLLPNSALQ